MALGILAQGLKLRLDRAVFGLGLGTDAGIDGGLHGSLPSLFANGAHSITRGRGSKEKLSETGGRDTAVSQPWEGTRSWVRWAVGGRELTPGTRVVRSGCGAARPRARRCKVPKTVSRDFETVAKEKKKS